MIRLGLIFAIATTTIVLVQFNILEKKGAYIYYLEKRTVKPTMTACNKMIFEEMESHEGFIQSTRLPVRKP